MMVKQEITPELRERYSPGYGDEIVASFADRTVSVEAAFFQPHLRPGMNVLDCGCGPGTITMGLARLVNPGVVTGIDREPSQVERSLAACDAQGIANVSFQTASIYSLPFADETFDAAFAHAVLQHLSDPLAALREIHRVLKPGGVVGVRDDDIGGMVLAPASPSMDKALVLIRNVMRANGANPTVGRTHRELLLQAGFARSIGSASVECDGTSEATARRGNLATALLEHMSEVAVSQGWATKSEVEELAQACKEWGERPDAYDAIIWCEAVGWKG